MVKESWRKKQGIGEPDKNGTNLDSESVTEFPHLLPLLMSGAPGCAIVISASLSTESLMEILRSA